MVTKRPVQQVAPVAPPTIQTSPQLKSPSGSKKKEGTSPLLSLRKGKIILHDRNPTCSKTFITGLLKRNHYKEFRTKTALKQFLRKIFV